MQKPNVAGVTVTALVRFTNTPNLVEIDLQVALQRGDELWAIATLILHARGSVVSCYIVQVTTWEHSVTLTTRFDRYTDRILVVMVRIPILKRLQNVDLYDRCSK